MITEKPDKLHFSNLGSFIPGSIENVIKQNYPIEKLRNPFLTAAMVNLNMIDTIGAGIVRMITYQKNRYFPLPSATSDSFDAEICALGEEAPAEKVADLTDYKENELLRLYYNQLLQKHRTQKAAAKAAGVSENAIARRLQTHGIKPAKSRKRD